MRTAAACLVLAAAIATPGIVVAATSSASSHLTATAALFTGTGTGSGTYFAQPPERSPRLRFRIKFVGPHTALAVDPRLRPAARALEKAFARQGITLIALPSGNGAAILWGETRQLTKGCPTAIVLRTLDAPPSKPPPCPSRGAGLAGGLKLSYTPAAIGPTVALALRSLPR